MAQLCINLLDWDESAEKRIQTTKKAGFDGIFFEWENADMAKEYAAAIDRAGLFLQSIHAHFYTVNTIWHEHDPKGDETIETLIRCVDDCATFGTPILVCHAFIGFDEHEPTEIGLQRLETLLEHGAKKGVKLAFENTEGEEYLAAIMERFHDCPSLGFCLDSGHELCYNRGRDRIALYGNKLCATHLNDNFGVTGDDITWLDDSHVLPFDGIADWNGIAARLKACAFQGPLTFELTRRNKPDRHTHDKYEAWSHVEFLENAYERACRFEELMK